MLLTKDFILILSKLTSLIKALALSGPILIGFTYIALNFIYLAPPNPLTKNIKVPVNKFMTAYFPQGWQLFAPNPGYTSVKLLIRCKSNNQTSSWFNPTEKILKEHYKSRFSTAGILMKQYKFIATDMNNYIINKSRKCKREGCENLNELIQNSVQRDQLLKFSNHTCQGSFENFSDFEFKLIEIFPQPYTQKDNKNKFSKINLIMKGTHPKL